MMINLAGNTALPLPCPGSGLICGGLRDRVISYPSLHRSQSLVSVTHLSSEPVNRGNTCVCGHPVLRNDHNFAARFERMFAKIIEQVVDAGVFELGKFNATGFRVV